MFRLISIITSICICIGIASARILNVPDDYQTIQAGIDAAEEGDTVLVQSGIYYESVSFEGKAIIVASLTLSTGDASYVDSTIIDGQNEHSVVRFINEEDENSILIGFTIQNGLGDFDDQNTRCGGGLFIRGASPRLQHLKIIENSAWYGGGVLIQLNADALFEDCEIIQNDSERFGGAAIHCSRRSKGKFFRSVISNNYAGQLVAITCVSSSTLEFTNCTITRNTTRDGYPSLISTLNNANHIFLRNTIVENSDIYVGYGGTDDTLLVSYSDIVGGRDSVVVLREDSDSDVLWRDGNIDADPNFLDPDNGDYSLSPDSPCIDAGDPDSPPDPDGTRADMGAFYFHQRDIRVIHEIADIEVNEDCGYIAIANLDTVFSDPDGDTLGYSVEGSDQLGLTIDEAGVLGVEPALNFFGDSLVVTVFAFDAEDTTSLDFSVTVNPVNDAPSPFGLVSPEDGVVLYDSSEGSEVIFCWERSFDPDSGSAVGYEISVFLRIEEGGDAEDSLIFVEEVDDTTYRYDFDRFDESKGYRFYDILWSVRAMSQGDVTNCNNPFMFTMWYELSVKGERNIPPNRFELLAAYPNPFNSSTTIRFSTGSAAHPTRLLVYDLSGRLVQTLFDNSKLQIPNSKFSVVWNAEGLPDGIYLIRLESASETRTIKTLLVR